jgi:hypothetical protein
MGLITETQREANIKEDRASRRFELDPTQIYHPVFCLTKVPDAVSSVNSEPKALTFSTVHLVKG